MMRGCLLTLALFVLGSATLPLRAGLITNGSFEVSTPGVTPGTFTDFLAGSTGITGWTVVGTNDVNLISGTFAQECCTFPAEDGNLWVDLTGTNANVVDGVEQTVATTAGTNYTLTFWVGNIFDPGGIFGTTSSVQVRLGGISGTSLGTFTNSSTTPGIQVWQQFSTSFTAAGPSTTIDFLNADPIFDNTNGLDNVSLIANASSVPEPGTLGLLSAALVGIGLRKCRRQSMSPRVSVGGNSTQTGVTVAIR
jgi:hypothetical protein